MKTRPTLSDSDLRLARIFRKIVECGGISAAEEYLGVGRSTISRQLQDFETRLGLILCERGRSGFRLTQAGEQTLQYIERLLAAVDDFTANIAGLSANLEGKLNIGLIDCSFADPHNPIVTVFKHFRSSAPNVTLNVSVGSAKELERGVLNGVLHLAVVPEYWFNDELDYFLLYNESIGLFTGSNHEIAELLRSGEPLTRAKVQQYPLIFRSSPEPPSLQRRKADFPRGPTIPDTEAVLSLVASGSYLGFLPTHLAASPLYDIIEILPDEYGYDMPIIIISKKDRHHSIVLKHFLTLVGKVRSARKSVASRRN